MEDFARDSKAELAHDSLGDKLQREAALLGNGLLGIKDAAAESVSRDHIAGTAATAALSVAAGLGLAYLSRGRGMSYALSRGAAVVGGSFLAKDLLFNGGDAAAAMADGWKSNANIAQDKEMMRESVGQTTFDTALATAGGVAGSAAGKRLFEPKIPDAFMSQFNHKTGITEDYYNAFGANEMRMKMLLDDSGLPPEILAQWRKELPVAIGKTETYRDYWDRQIAQHEQYNAGDNLDRRGIQNALYANYPNAKKLDALVTELRAFGGKDLTDPDVIKALGEKFQQARTIIYGPENTQQTRQLF